MKKHILYYLICFTSFSMHAQTVSQLTCRQAAGVETGYHMKHDKDGNTIIAGMKHFPNGAGGGAATVNNMYVQKYDVNGVSQWLIESNNTSANNNMGLGGLAIDTLGNVFLSVGFIGQTVTIGSMTYTGNPTGTDDFFIMKISPNGTIQWMKGADAGNSFNAYRNSGKLTITPSQEVLWVGNFYREMKLGSIVLPGNSTVPYLNNPYPPCGVIAKMTNDGTFVWAKQIEHLSSGQSNMTNGMLGAVMNDYDEIFAFVGLDSGIVIGGIPIVSPTPTSYSDVMGIVKLNTSGDLLGHKIINSPIGFINDLILNNCGEPLIIGQFNVSVAFDSISVSSSSFNSYVAKFNRNLMCSWISSYGSDGADEPGGLAINRQNEVYYSFDFWGTITMEDTFTPSPTTVLDMAIVKLDENGDYVWSMHTYDGGYGRAGQMSVSQGDIPYLIGDIRNSKSMQGQSVFTLNSTHNDIFIAKINDTTIANGSVVCTDGWLEIEEIKAQEIFQVYPNPAGSYFMLETSIPKSQFQILTLTGTLVKSIQTNASLSKVDCHDLSNGVYFIRHGQSGQIQKMIVK